MISDEGATHHFGDDCPGGHRAANVAGEANAREAAEQEFADLALAARGKHVFVNVTTCACGFQPPMSGDWERHRMGAALAAVVPLIRAQVAAEHDDPRHVIEFREDGWTIKHPPSCRPNLFECPVNRAAERDLTEPPSALGRFECSVDDIGDRLYIGDRIEAAQRPDTEGGVDGA